MLGNRYEVTYKGEVVVVHADTPYEAKMKACVHFGLKGPECIGLNDVKLVGYVGDPLAGEVVPPVLKQESTSPDLSGNTPHGGAYRAHAENRSRKGAFVPTSFDFTVRPHDITGGVAQLQENGREQSWMVFLFDTAKPCTATDDVSLALQYSVWNGRVGLEWVLLGPRNIADRDEVAAFMRSRGHRVEARTLNSVEFLRVEDGDVTALGRDILAVLYQVPNDAKLGLLIDGIVLSWGQRTVP